MEPAFYSQRFFDFIIKLLVSDDQDKDDSGEDGTIHLLGQILGQVNDEILLFR